MLDEMKERTDNEVVRQRRVFYKPTKGIVAKGLENSRDFFSKGNEKYCTRESYRKEL